MPDGAKEYSFNVIEFPMGADESCFWRIWISQDVNKSLETLLDVYDYADILLEGALRAIGRSEIQQGTGAIFKF